MTSVDCPSNMEEVVGHATLRIDAIAADNTQSADGTESEASKGVNMREWVKVIRKADNTQSADGTKSGEGARLDLGREQLLNVHVRLTLPQSDICDEKEAGTHLVLVVDKSGSMAGTAWKQVQESLKDLIGRSIGLSSVTTDLIVYDSIAKHVQFQADNYVKVIDDIKASNSTNFKSAFEKIITVVKNEDVSVRRTVVVFMTDGQDTTNAAGTAYSLIGKLAEMLKTLGKDTCIHTVGFTSGHNFDFLKKLAESGGTTPGMFRYCEPGENTVSLQQKLDELFDFLLHNTNQPAFINLGMIGTNSYFITGNQQNKQVVIDGNLEQEQGEIHVTGDAWVHIDDFQDLPQFQVILETKITQSKPQSSQGLLERVKGMFTQQVKEVKNITVPCISEKPELQVIKSANEKALWRLRILTRNVDDLVTRTATAIANKEDVSHFQEKVEKYHRTIAHTRVFGNGFTKDVRETMFSTIKDIQASLDKIQSMLAEFVRSGTGSISLLARAHDMRYQAVFSKSRRHRVMDKRVSKNMKYAQEAQNNLATLRVDEQEVRGLSQDAQQFYFCVLSQDSVQDVLLGEDKADAIGFGLAVKRSEVVLDEPTLIRLQVISGTLVSRNAMLDALEYKINVSSHLSAHGGFNFKNASLGVTTVGAGREPINAWLPLYITKSHWDRVKVILKPSLGSFCTLDPLGYDYKQLDVLFSVLGSMIGQLTDKNVGEHRLRLLFAVQRTCAACLEEFDLLDTVKETVKKFLASPEGRTKDVIANLYTLIGYIVSMPTATVREIFGMEDEENKLSGFWLGLISELVRRTTGSLYHDASSHVINGLLHALLRGNGSLGNSDKITYSQVLPQLLALCRDSSIDGLDLNIQPYDPSTEIEVPTPVMKHDPKVDKSMEIWAQGKTGYLKNLIKNKKYKEATKVVKNWLKEMSVVSEDGGNKAVETDCLGNAPEHDPVEDEDDDENVEEVDVHDDDDDDKPDGESVEVAGHETEAGSKASAESEKDKTTTDTETVVGQFDFQHVTPYMLKVIAQLHNKICRAAFPGIQSLPACMAFVNNWLSRQHDIHDLDTNSGLPPQEWIENVRTAITEVYTELNEYENVMMAQSTDNNEGQGTDIVIKEAGTQQEGEQGSREELTLQETELVEQKGSNNSDNPVDDIGDDVAASSGDNDSDYDVDEDYYDDSYTTASRRQEERKKKQAKANSLFALPTILQYLKKDQDTMLLLRSMLCQAVRFHSNSSARAAITNNTLLDLKDGDEVRTSTLCDYARFMEELKEKLVSSMFEKVTWQQANYCMLHATTTWAFVGYLMNTHKSRLEGFIDLVDLLFNTTSEGQTVTCLHEKVHVLLTGKYEELPVLDNGNQWLPEKKMAAKFKTLLGPEVWMNFEIELRSSVMIHVYRESDIPNRHSHCNSNPYIPNVLRAKLGMELIKEGRRNMNRRRRRRH